jgi:hypothetical protein
MSTDKESGSLYSYDPFGTGGSQSRWGRKGAEEADLPEIVGYEILDKLGSGGMGSVWTARYLPLNQLRAVKVLSSELAEDGEFLKRFSQEAKAMGRIEHPNIIKVFDANAEHKPPYIAMQWVEGETLSQILGKRVVPPAEAVRWFEQIAQALDYAHSLGFVHRDIKPSNVMITKDGKAMLIDFGVASALGQDPGSGNTITGTTRYLSPEVCEGRMATSASDIWALGVMIYRTLSGDLPFNDKSPDAVRKKIVTEAPADPKNVNLRTKKFLLKALEKDPAERYKSATKMVQDLKWITTPLVPKVKGDQTKLFGSMAMFMGGGVILAAVLGTFFYTAFRHRQQDAARLIVVQKADSQDSGTFGATRRPPDVSLAAALAPGMKDLKGVWFADLGTQWQDIVIEPTGGKAFKGTIEVRDTAGVVTVALEGELGDRGKSVNYHETKIVSNPANVAYIPVSFSGTFSEDRSQVAGIHGPAGSPNIRLVKSEDLTLTPYENAQAGFSLSLPPGWTANDASAGTQQITNFSPPGSTDVVMKVVIEPTSGSTLEDIFAAREAAFQTQGGYQKLNLNPQATFGGRNAVSWDFRKQVAGVNAHCLAFGVLRGDSTVTVESWVPADKESIWAPVLERMRTKFQFTN